MSNKKRKNTSTSGYDRTASRIALLWIRSRSITDFLTVSRHMKCLFASLIMCETFSHRRTRHLHVLIRNNWGTSD